ncbi:uncharacterized protein LOC131885959 [Tigriopus californicus]|uniref:uncharacterized protein LOC131885959 n=1 Tax=Tigriopus californicus TaxID=6832 RepID=UPI0027DA71CA|nr:uncharacterized protein LOC131885959 [Tigriopus californicus]
MAEAGDQALLHYFEDNFEDRFFRKVLEDIEMRHRIYLESDGFKLKRAFKKSGITSSAKTKVLIYATMHASKAAILECLNGIPVTEWASPVRRFFRRCTCQDISQEKCGVIAVNRIPCVFPDLTATHWVRFCPVPTIGNMIRHLWFAQLNVSEGLLRQQKNWEMSVSQELGMGEFQGYDWESKSNDMYPLRMPNGSIFKPENDFHTRTDIEEWIALYPKAANQSMLDEDLADSKMSSGMEVQGL